MFAFHANFKGGAAKRDKMASEEKVCFVAQYSGLKFVIIFFPLSSFTSLQIPRNWPSLGNNGEQKLEINQLMLKIFHKYHHRYMNKMKDRERRGREGGKERQRKR